MSEGVGHPDTVTPRGPRRPASPHPGGAATGGGEERSAATGSSPISTVEQLIVEVLDAERDRAFHASTLAKRLACSVQALKARLAPSIDRGDLLALPHDRYQSTKPPGARLAFETWEPTDCRLSRAADDVRALAALLGLDPATVAAPSVLSTVDKTPMPTGPVVEPRPGPGRRRRRHGKGPRSKTIAAKHLTREEVRAGKLIEAPEIARPRTRGDCQNGPRPCPWVSCAHHLYLDVNPDLGSIKLNWPTREPDELAETCALDVADRGGAAHAAVGVALNLSRERVRQVERLALRKLRGRKGIEGMEG